VFNELGRVVVLVEDQDEALRFYRDVLGFEVLHDETLDGLRYLHAGPPAQANVGVWLLPPASDSERERIGRQAGDQPLLVLYTDDLDAARAGLAEHGVEVWAERTDPGSRSLHFRDLVGNVIVGVQLTG
jgi:catechol 2,3-dioxygenase-like lactoylglutathione lyase family enzyme